LTAPQQKLVAPSLQEALRALIAGSIGARIGADTTGPAHTTVHIALGMERISRAIVGTPISRTTAIKITSNPIMGTATGNGGSSDRAISIIGEAPWAARNQRVTVGLADQTTALQST
jgi:hypothetical protein